MPNTLPTITFWEPSQPWYTGAAPVLDSAYTDPTHEAQINGYLTTLWHGGVGSYADMVSGATIGFGHRIQGAWPNGANPGQAFKVSGYNVLGVDFGADALAYYINDHGKVVQDDPALMLAHEISHDLKNTADTTGTGPGGHATQADMNAAGFDFKASAVRFQNSVATDLGKTDHLQAAYDASWIHGSTLAGYEDPGLRLGKDYTGGQYIDDARLGTSASDLIDHTARTDSSSDLIFGLDGKDTIKGGTGHDYIYGGRNDDSIETAGSDGAIYGETADDKIKASPLAGVGPSNMTVSGGVGNDKIDFTVADPNSTASTYRFAVGDGHDKIWNTTITSPNGSFIWSGFDQIIVNDHASDMKLLWDYHVKEIHNTDPSGVWYKVIEGNAVLVLSGTGDSIYLGDMIGRYDDTDHDGNWTGNLDWFSISADIVLLSGTQWDVKQNDITQADVSSYDMTW